MCNEGVPFQMEIRKISPWSSTFCRRRRTWSFHVLVLQRTSKKCTKIYNARAQLLFCSLNLLFGDVLVPVVVVVCLSSLLTWVSGQRVGEGGNCREKPLLCRLLPPLTRLRKKLRQQVPDDFLNCGAAFEIRLRKSKNYILTNSL